MNSTWSLALKNLESTFTKPPTPALTTKQCSGNHGCGKVLPVSEFNISKVNEKTGRPKYFYLCRECGKKRQKIMRMKK